MDNRVGSCYRAFSFDMRIKPFQCLRPPPDRAARVAALPYDVVTTDEARRIADGNEDCFFHITRAEIDLPPGTSPYDDAVYKKAAENLQAFVKRGALMPDREPALYLYRLRAGSHCQIGLLTVCHTEDYESGVIKKHELTRTEPETDRTRHILAVGAHTGPVFLAYRDSPKVDALAAAEAQNQPVYDFIADDGVQHTLWRICDPSPWVEAFAEIPCAYIADGHHRAAAAARAARERRRAEPTNPNAEYLWFLAGLFPAGQLRILAYNRLVRDLGPMRTSDLLKALQNDFDVLPAADGCPRQRGHIHMFFDGTWRLLVPRKPVPDDPLEGLDVSLLQSRVLSPLLGITEPRNNPRLEFVGGLDSVAKIERAVREGRAAVGFSLYPTSIQQLMDIADRGLTMPPKSTWFDPKLRSGLVVHPLDPI